MPEYCSRFPDTCDKANKLRINPKTRFLVDSYGRTTLLHGVNAIYKVDPYIPLTDEFDPQNSLNDDDIANLKKWGMNFVRLGVMWEGVEREAGVYDMAYLDKVEALINKMGEAGIYTLVDAHQDVFARFMCGEGIPDFYAQEAIGMTPSCINPIVDVLLKDFYASIGSCNDMNDLNYRVDDNGDFLIEDCLQEMFANYYNTKQSVTGFGSLFTNKQNMNDKFVAYWDATSARFAGNPYVVGYDPLNEPFPANNVRDPTLRIPGVMDRKHLAPTYSAVFDKYINNDSDAIMWFEPVTDPDVDGWLNGGTIFPVGFAEPPGGEYNSVNHVLNDHTYCCQLGGWPSPCETGEPSTDLAEECLVWHKKRIGVRSTDAERLGIPYHITEFGACLTEAPCTQEIKQVCDVADEHLVGWAYWQFKYYEDLTTSAGTGSEGFYNQDGSLQEWKAKALARSYLMYTQGALTSQHFDTETAALNATFVVDTSIKAPTVIYQNTEYWCTAQDGCACSYFDHDEGVQLDASQFKESFEDQITNFTVHDHKLNGKSISVSCAQSSEQPQIVQE